jgi:hypothetical protein
MVEVLLRAERISFHVMKVIRLFTDGMRDSFCCLALLHRSYSLHLQNKIQKTKQKQNGILTWHQPQAQNSSHQHCQQIHSQACACREAVYRVISRVAEI